MCWLSLVFIEFDARKSGFAQQIEPILLFARRKAGDSLNKQDIQVLWVVRRGEICTELLFWQQRVRMRRVVRMLLRRTDFFVFWLQDRKGKNLPGMNLTTKGVHGLEPVIFQSIWLNFLWLWICASGRLCHKLETKETWWGVMVLLRPIPKVGVAVALILYSLN